MLLYNSLLSIFWSDISSWRAFLKVSLNVLIVTKNVNFSKLNHLKKKSLAEFSLIRFSQSVRSHDLLGPVQTPNFSWAEPNSN